MMSVIAYIAVRVRAAFQSIVFTITTSNNRATPIPISYFLHLVMIFFSSWYLLITGTPLYQITYA